MMAHATLSVALLLALVGPGFARQYTHELGLRFVKTAYAAYCPVSNLQSWDCKWCSEISGFNVHTAHLNTSTNIQFFTGYDSQLGMNVLSFRGTVAKSIRNWIEDLNAGHTSTFPPGCSGCEAHDGFRNAWLSVRSPVLEALNSMNGGPLAITGHSLGAALTTIAAADLGYMGYDIPLTVTFGEPRSGNKAFADHVDNTVATRYRVTHWKDIVPHAPPEFSNFHHTSLEIFYQSNSESWKQCNGSGEDKSCADQFGDFWQWSVSDHLDYLNLHESC